jgi:hypothetical protein
MELFHCGFRPWFVRMISRICNTTNNTMDDGRKEALEEAQHRDEVLVVNEFDFPFLRWG